MREPMNTQAALMVGLLSIAVNVSRSLVAYRAAN